MLNIWNNILSGGAFNKFVLGEFQVVEDTIEAVTMANTGLAFDYNRRRLYSAITPDSKSNIRAFTESYNLIEEIPIKASQGIAYDGLNDYIIAWGVGFLKTTDMSGNLISNQSVDIYGDGTVPGSVCYDSISDCLYFSVDGGTKNIRKYIRNGLDWDYDSEITTTGLQEGVTHDFNTDTLWHNTGTKLRNIELDGTLINELDQPPNTLASNEGLAYNPFRKTLYINEDAFFHGSTPNGNICVEVWPGFYD